MDEIEKVPQAAWDAVAEIVADMTDRRGLRQAWESIDEDIREEIAAKWAAIVSARMVPR